MSLWDWFIPALLIVVLPFMVLLVIGFVLWILTLMFAPLKTKVNNFLENLATNRSSVLPEEDPWGRWVLRFILLLIPVGACVGMIWVLAFYQSGGNNAVSNFQTSLGALDPALGDKSRYLMCALIFVTASLIESALILAYGAFYLNDPTYSGQPLGLPPGAIRIFLLIIIIFVTLFFSLLPGAWGENKAVVFLFGILSTVVGFYFGSRRDEEQETGATVKMSLTKSNFTKENLQLTCRLSPGFDATYLGRPLQIWIRLIKGDGTVVDKSQRLGVLDSSGQVSFDYRPDPPDDIKNLNMSTSYIAQVTKPKNIICDDRFTVEPEYNGLKQTITPNPPDASPTQPQNQATMPDVSPPQR